MADKTIGELPSASEVTSGSLIPLEQSGVAYKMTGAQFQSWAVAGAQPYADAAAQSAQDAASSSASASASATAAETARQTIEDMGATATTLSPGSSATVTKIISPSGALTLEFGLPQGATGQTGATGPQGPQGVGGLAVPTDSQYAFTVDNNGHLICSYVGDAAPDFSINENGHLILDLGE